MRVEGQTGNTPVIATEARGALLRGPAAVDRIARAADLARRLAAQDLCSGLRPYLKTHHVQPGVGHYGVFNGKKWENSIYPVLRDVIQMTQQTLAH